jgi:hypothetical protein
MALKTHQSILVNSKVLNTLSELKKLESDNDVAILSLHEIASLRSRVTRVGF